MVVGRWSGVGPTGLVAVAAFVGLVQWLPPLVDRLSSHRARTGYLDNPAMT